MKIFKFSELNEYVKYQEFKDALKFDDWSDFSKDLSLALEKGFTNIDELLVHMNMDKSFYDLVKQNMIYNWQDSVSKSLLHGISGVDLEVPEKGDVIFKSPIDQTRFLIVCGPGYQSNSMFYGQSHSTQGLNRWGWPSIIDSESGRSLFGSRIDSNKNYTLHTSKHAELNRILKYVWIYVFFNDYLIKSRNIKFPKMLYRGIRFYNLNKYPIFNELVKDVKRDETLGKFGYEKMTKDKMSLVLDYIVKNGISEFVDGEYLSFTSSKSAAEYFANDEGFLICIDPKKVRVVTSPLTDESFDDYNYLSKRKEMEYIVKLPENYKFKKEDIIISSEDYYIGDNSPLAVPFFGHDNKKAEYELYVPEKDKKYQITAKFLWSSNTKGNVNYRVEEIGGKHSYYETASKIKKEFGFDPTPKESNLQYISNFKIKEDSRY